MSVNDEANYPWLKIEKDGYVVIWRRKACDRTLSRGQLIANALGAAVSRNRYQELGWSTVQRVPNLPKESFYYQKNKCNAVA